MKKFKSLILSVTFSLPVLFIPSLSFANDKESLGNPVLQSKISTQALDEDGLKAIVGTGVTANTAGTNALNALYTASSYLYYARYTAPSNSSTEAQYYALGTSYSGLAAYYGGLAAYYSLIGY